jgi:hypothetical protein
LNKFLRRVVLRAREGLALTCTPLVEKQDVELSGVKEAPVILPKTSTGTPMQENHWDSFPVSDQLIEEPVAVGDWKVARSAGFDGRIEAFHEFVKEQFGLMIFGPRVGVVVRTHERNLRPNGKYTPGLETTVGR